MNFKFRKMIGETEFEITEEAKNHVEFIKKASFFSSLPTKGPNGETDLELRARQTKKGYYYSIVSPSAKKEFNLGQYQEPRLGELYPKGWVNLYSVEDSTEEEDSTTTIVEVKPEPAKPLLEEQPKKAVNSAPKMNMPPKPATMNKPILPPRPTTSPLAVAPSKIEQNDVEEKSTNVNSILQKYMK